MIETTADTVPVPRELLEEAVRLLGLAPAAQVAPIYLQLRGLLTAPTGEPA